MADTIYNSFKTKLFNGGIDLDTDTIKVMLVVSNYSPNQDAHEFISSVSADEVSGTGYVAGGKTLTNVVVSQDNTDNEGVMTADNPLWENSSITARYAVLYKDTGTPSSSPVILCIDFGEDKTSDNGDFQLTWNSEGILNIN